MTIPCLLRLFNAVLHYESSLGDAGCRAEALASWASIRLASSIEKSQGVSQATILIIAGMLFTCLLKTNLTTELPYGRKQLPLTSFSDLNGIDHKGRRELEKFSADFGQLGITG